MISIYIMWILLFLQAMSLGFVIAKLGNPREGKYDGSHVAAHVITSLLFMYVLWEIYSI